MPPVSQDKAGVSNSLPNLMAKIHLDNLLPSHALVYEDVLALEGRCNEIDRIEEARVREVGCTELEALLANSYTDLVNLHISLIQKYKELIFACSHSAGLLALVPATSGIPVRLWRSGIHTCLDILRHHLPDSLEHILMFINTAYQEVTSLSEQDKSRKATWLEVLGDLAR